MLFNLQKAHDKSYPAKEEDEKRMKLYFETKEKVKKHNESFAKGETTFTMCINKFADQVNENLSHNQSNKFFTYRFDLLLSVTRGSVLWERRNETGLKVFGNVPCYFINSMHFIKCFFQVFLCDGTLIFLF